MYLGYFLLDFFLGGEGLFVLDLSVVFSYILFGCERAETTHERASSYLIEPYTRTPSLPSYLKYNNILTRPQNLSQKLSIHQKWLPCSIEFPRLILHSNLVKI